MADNVAVTEGSGKVVASDEIQVDGAHTQGQAQFVKLVDGTLNGTGSIRVNQAAKANALTVAPASDISDATYIGDIKFGEALPAGTNEIGKLAAGTAAIGKLAANSGVDIGDVTLTAGTNAFGKLTANSGVDIGDVTINNANGASAVHIQDGGNTITIDGSLTTVSTVTAITSLDKGVYVDDAAWTGNTSSHYLVGGLYQSSPQTVTDGRVAPIEIDVNGKIIESNSAAIKTSVEKIDDWDAVHASAVSSDGPQIMGAGYSTGLPADIGADADAARICTDRFGRIVRGLMPQNFSAIFDSANASAEGNTVKAATASRKIYILSLTISVDTEMWVKLQDEDSNAITPKFWLKAGGGLVKTYPPEAPLVLDVANKALEVITEGAGDIGVEITGYLAV